jgi:hypothetical protein
MKRLNIVLYDDEYEYVKAQSEAKRISMNKILQYIIRDVRDTKVVLEQHQDTSRVQVVPEDKKVRYISELKHEPIE